MQFMHLLSIVFMMKIKQELLWYICKLRFQSHYCLVRWMIYHLQLQCRRCVFTENCVLLDTFLASEELSSRIIIGSFSIFDAFWVKSWRRKLWRKRFNFCHKFSERIIFCTEEFWKHHERPEIACDNRMRYYPILSKFRVRPIKILYNFPQVPAPY